MRHPDDHYAALDVDPAATREEIREAWRFHLTAFRPDRFRDPTQRSRKRSGWKAVRWNRQASRISSRVAAGSTSSAA